MGQLLPLIAQLTPDQRRRLRYTLPALLPGNIWYQLDWTNMFHKLLSNRLRAERQTLPIEVARTLFPHAPVVTYWSHSW